VENATVTFETLKSRFTTVKRVAFIDDTTVTCTGEYTLDNAIEGQPVSFTVKVKNGGSVTSVTYGEDVITANAGVYTITVDDAKTLKINTTRDGYAPVDGMLTVDGGVQRDIIDHSTANNHPTWSQNKDTLNNKTETVVYQEPVVFYTDSLDTNRTTAKLMYPVENIVAVTSYTTINGKFVKYYKDKDFTITENGQIELTANTTIPRNFALNEMKTGVENNKGETSIWNGAGKWTQDSRENQILVTYTYTKTWDDVDYSVPTYYNSLSTAYDKLSSGDTLDVLFIGDSISTGCNASGQDGVFYTYRSDAVGGTTTIKGWSSYLGLGTEPYWVNDSWDKQVVANLKAAYPNATINATNRSVGSSASKWYFDHIDELLVTGELGNAGLENTDLVFIGFGMNEGNNTASTQNANIKKIIDYLRQKNPDVSVVLVSAFYPTFWDSKNQIWTNNRLGEQEDGYFELAKEYKNIAVAPVNTAFTNLWAAKEGVDYISNGINHPNDYGVNLYADTITATLINNATVTAPNSLDLLSCGIVEGTGASKGKQTTAMYLFAKYDAPLYDSGKTANTRKIILDDGNVATVVSRTFYVATKSVYDGLANKDDFGKVDTIKGIQKVTSTSIADLCKYWRKTDIPGTNNAETTFGVRIKNITKDRKDTAFAV
ncbi:MAG: SGNH/GDSL hydrolase family protein, partial [Acutalibacteraceae bacterium]|nr:SGNH/GDSL hydrolase family protein [Acutalibacteraceae bacterium]